MAGPTGSMDELAELRATAMGCTRCALAGGRTQVVFGVGNPGAELMFVGEAPGRDEDLAGEPFVGRSGKLLDTLMGQEIGVDRTGCYVANVIKCLRGDARVQLGDGAWAPIGDMVRRRYGGAVRSVDGEGRIVGRRVTGWHTSPLAGRRVFRLSYRTAHQAGAGAEAWIHATGDHEVLTEDGWRRVDRLPARARIATGQGPRPASVRHPLAVGVGAAAPVLDRAPPEGTWPLVQYEEAVVREVEAGGPDETFYCLDVEETHNFVTAGGVVHNCRPPGNRDPLPAEVEACRPYLDRQIALIGPSVVITLGNFATRVLLDTTEGITRLRGRAYPFGNGHVVPTYHPAAALRGGGEKVAEMRADFVRAKGLLGRGRPAGGT